MSLSLLIMRGSKKWVKNELIRLAVLSSLGFLLISHRNLAACFVCRDIRLAHRASLQLQRNTIKALYMTSSSSTAVSRPWYSHPDLERDRSHVLGAPNTLSDLLLHDDQDNSGMWAKSRFILMTKRGTWHLTEPHSAPLFLSRPQIKVILGQRNDGMLLEKAVDEPTQEPFLVWVGKYQEVDYWVVYLETEAEQLETTVQRVLTTESTTCKPLREFGDVLESNEEASILATAQGLVEFHKSHSFCSFCGGATSPAKAGACRKCRSCQRSVYPRIDVAAIMLVTSPCEQYALLGRKASWPAGRYSTLAGFCEVGETMEDCCCRETFEESGVVVDPSTVHFIASQPWPFPRSIMVGFRAKAQSSDNDTPPHPLPMIIVDTDEMQDIQWFAKDFVKKRLKGGSTAFNFHPNEEEAIFHIPGKASLARLLITRWTEEP
jgi:NADH pyrophosphatase NudC (nudix superfamily)